MGILKSLTLRNYRNYEHLDLFFQPGITVLVGDNGHGKTNLLESIYFLSILRSFRSRQVRDLYRWEKSSFLIRAVISDGTGSYPIAVQYDTARHLRVRGRTVAKASEFIGNLICVAFVPEDILLIKGSAGERRRFLNITLTQLYAGYLPALQDYHSALKSRNALLRAKRLDTGAVRAFDTVMAAKGATITRQRRDFFSELEERLAMVSTELLADVDSIEVRYQPSAMQSLDEADPPDYEATLYKALQDGLERDAQRCFTHSGPHRDDYGFFLHGKALQTYGSEGQCRMAALLLKLATSDLARDHKGEDSVTLLIDDVIGELDTANRRRFFARINAAAQVFFVCTDSRTAAEMQGAGLYRVQDGNVTHEG